MAIKIVQKALTSYPDPALMKVYDRGPIIVTSTDCRKMILAGLSIHQGIVVMIMACYPTVELSSCQKM